MLWKLSYLWWEMLLPTRQMYLLRLGDICSCGHVCKVNLPVDAGQVSLGLMAWKDWFVCGCVRVCFLADIT